MNVTWESVPWLLLGIVVGTILGVVLSSYWFNWRHHPKPSLPMTEAEARAIDPNRPPTYQVYKPRSGVSSLKCTCHQEQVPVGAKVLLWPIPNHPEEAMDVLCERTYKQAES